MNILKSTIYLVCLMLFASCYTINSLRTDEALEIANNAAIGDKEIEVYCTKDAAKPYVILGQIMVAADAGMNAKKPVEILKKKAAKMGADAVIELRLEFNQGYWAHGLKATATAIKYK